MDEQFLFPNEPTRFTPQEVDALLVHCNNLNSSDITIQTAQPVFAEIYGRLHKVTRRILTQPEVSEILNAIYGPNGTTQILSGEDIDTHYECRPTRSERYRFRVNGTGCQVEGHHGIQITMRTIPDEPPTLEEMALEPELEEAIAPDQGIVFVTGSTGSGKSTLLAAIIRKLLEAEEGHRKILTYESPIEFVYDRIQSPSSVISQTEIPLHLPSFADGVRNALRRKPRIILVGEARDEETIAAVIEAALTGHPVYTTLHSNGVAETLRRLVMSFPIEARSGLTVDLVETMRVVIWQKLVPTVDGKRVALREYLIFNEEIRDRLLAADLDNITAITRDLVKTHGQSMLSDATKKYEEGVIAQRDYQLLKHMSESVDKDSMVRTKT